MGVLPFLGGDAADDEDLSLSISQGAAAELARVRWLDVIPPGALMQRPAPVGASDATQSHDLDYIVDGAVSCDGKRLQVSVRLVDLTEYARTLWSERFVLPVGELREANELIASRILGAIDPVVLFFDGQPKRRKRDGATGLLLRAIPLIYSMERQKHEKAGLLINQALEAEPDNPTAAAWAAFWQVLYFGQGWTQDLATASGIAQEHSRRAMSLSQDDPETLIMCGHVSSFLSRDYDKALYYFDRAQRLGSSLPFTWAWSALTYCYVGKPSVALERLKHCSHLAPIDCCFSWSQNIHAVTYTFAGDYEKSVALSRRVTQRNPNFTNGYKPLVASLGHLGRRDEARPYVEKLLALEPGFTVERFGQVYPIKYESDRERYMTGLRLAGVPER